MHVSTLLTTAVIVLGLLIAIAGSLGVWSAFKTQRNVQVAKLYQDTAEGWQKKSEMLEGQVEDLTNEKDRLKAQNATQARQIADLHGQIAVLRDVVSGKSAVELLTTEFRDTASKILEEIHRNRQLYVETIEASRRKTT